MLFVQQTFLLIHRNVAISLLWDIGLKHYLAYVQCLLPLLCHQHNKIVRKLVQFLYCQSGLRTSRQDLFKMVPQSHQAQWICPHRRALEVHLGVCFGTFEYLHDMTSILLSLSGESSGHYTHSTQYSHFSKTF